MFHATDFCRSPDEIEIFGVEKGKLNDNDNTFSA
jgi:hypothetical protein